VATSSRLLKIVGLFCKRTLQKRLYSAKETNNFKEPTNCWHPIQSKIARGCQFSLVMSLFVPKYLFVITMNLILATCFLVVIIYASIPAHVRICFCVCMGICVRECTCVSV